MVFEDVVTVCCWLFDAFVTVSYRFVDVFNGFVKVCNEILSFAMFFMFL